VRRTASSAGSPPRRSPQRRGRRSSAPSRRAARIPATSAAPRFYPKITCGKHVPSPRCRRFPGDPGAHGGAAAEAISSAGRRQPPPGRRPAAVFRQQPTGDRRQAGPFAGHRSDLPQSEDRIRGRRVAPERLALVQNSHDLQLRWYRPTGRASGRRFAGYARGRENIPVTSAAKTCEAQLERLLRLGSAYASATARRAPIVSAAS
jgi:hypothetical protein